MKRYLIILGVVTGLALLMSVKDIALALAMLTLGFGLPVVFAATVALYLLCLFPAVYWWKENRTLGIALSVLLAFAVAIIPSRIGNRQAESLASARLAGDRAFDGDDKPLRSLEIVRRSSDNGGIFEGDEPCGPGCRALLTSGKLSWMRIVITNGSENGREPSSTFHAVRKGENCAVKGFRSSPEAICVLTLPDNGQAADMKLTFDRHRVRRKDTSAHATLASVRDYSTVEGILKGEATAAYRKTSIRVKSAGFPTILGPEFNGMQSQGIRIYRKSTEMNAYDFNSVLNDLGIAPDPARVAQEKSQAPEPFRDGITQQGTREMLAVLELPQTEPFSRSQARPISNWLSSARKIDTWTPELTEMFVRVVGDSRIQTPTFADQVFTRNPDVAKAAMPAIITALEQEHTNAIYTQARKIAYSFRTVDAAILKPHAARLAKLASQQDRTGAALRQSVGRLGIDPAPYLLPFEKDLESSAQGGRLLGACYADDQWAGKLVPALKRSVTEMDNIRGAKGDYVKQAAKALLRFGETDFVADALADKGFSERDISRLIKRSSSTRNNRPVC